MTFARSVLGCLFGFMVISATSAAPAAERVRIRFASHLPQPTNVSTSYEATCESTAYTLVVSKQPGAVTLMAAGRPDVDLTNTPLGAAMLDKTMAHRVGFNCPRDAVNIFFAALVVEDGVGRGIRHIASVKANGEISNSGPIDEPLDYFEAPAGRQ